MDEEMDEEIELCEICSNRLTDEDEHPVICNICNRGVLELPRHEYKEISE